MAKAKVKAKKKTCKAGWQCGKSCISRKKTCRKNLKNPQGKFIAQTYADYVSAVAGGGGGADVAEPTAPQSMPPTDQGAPVSGQKIKPPGQFSPDTPPGGTIPVTAANLAAAMDRLSDEDMLGIVEADARGANSQSGARHGFEYYAKNVRPEMVEQGQVVSNDQIKEVTGGRSGFRGDMDPQHYEQLRDLPKQDYVGFGIYGNGTYIAVGNPDKLSRHSEPLANPKRDAEQAARYAAQSYAEDNAAGVYQIGYTKDARGVNFSEIQALTSLENRQKLIDEIGEERVLKLDQLDPTTVAAALGADFMVVDGSEAGTDFAGEEHHVLLNRSKSVIADSAYSDRLLMPDDQGAGIEFTEYKPMSDDDYFDSL